MLLSLKIERKLKLKNFNRLYQSTVVILVYRLMQWAMTHPRIKSILIPHSDIIKY